MARLSLEGEPVTVVEHFPRYPRLQRGSGPAFHTNAFELFRQFAQENYAAFNLEKARANDRELLRQVSALAADTPA
ncbi:MAG: hypothetical protein FJ387_06760 [Verrucomicrobia bacterium]|nr:hypothetical protein [Verrucomicrobiota bacterium]